jgi:hypothetical protein
MLLLLQDQLKTVMVGLDPAIRALRWCVDGRVKPDHDDGCRVRGADL